MTRNQLRCRMRSWLREGKLAYEPTMQATTEADPKVVMQAMEYKTGRLLFDQIAMLKSEGYVRVSNVWYPPPID